MNCRSCNTIITENFCGNCGQPVKIDRVDWHYIVHEIQHVLHFEKGIFHTVKELLRNPGPSVHAFIRVDRSRLIKPVLFIVMTSLIYSTIEHLFHIEQGYVDYKGMENSAVSIIFNWLQNHYGYGNIIMGVFISFWLRLIYKTFQYNFFEILILLCFVMGMGMLIMACFAIFEGLTKIHTMQISGVLAVCYSLWAIGHFFDRKRVVSYLKALAAYSLGILTFSIVAILLGVVIELIRR